MKKHRKSKEEPLHFGLNDLCVTIGVLAGLAFGIIYFRRNPEEAMVSGGRFGGSSGGGHISATIYYMLLGGALGYIAYELYAKWKKRGK